MIRGEAAICGNQVGTRVVACGHVDNGGHGAGPRAGGAMYSVFSEERSAA